MNILQYLLIGAEVILSVTLILLILVQKTKSGGGLGTAFGGGGAETIFGSRAGNVLTKATVVLGTVWVLNTVCLAMLFSNKSEQLLIDASALAVPASTIPAAASSAETPAVPAVPVAE